jgi:hypothetical protein
VDQKVVGKCTFQLHEHDALKANPIHVKPYDARHSGRGSIAVLNDVVDLHGFDSAKFRLIAFAFLVAIYDCAGIIQFIKILFKTRHDLVEVVLNDRIVYLRILCVDRVARCLVFLNWRRVRITELTDGEKGC